MPPMGIETTTWFHQRPTHRPVAKTVTQAQLDEDQAWKRVEAITDNIAFYRNMGEWDTLEREYAKYDVALKAAKMASNWVYELKRIEGNG